MVPTSKEQTQAGSSFRTSVSLFATDLPSNVTIEKLRETFRDFGHTHTIITSNKDDESCTANIQFSSTTIAEKALATMHLRPLPDIWPSGDLLTLSPDAQRPLSWLTSGNPRLVKHFPSHLTELQLYELVRPFGRCAYVFIDKDIGANVQFWTDEDAQAAEKAFNAHTSDTKMKLKAYDPCTLFCSNLNREIDKRMLEDMFCQFGATVGTHVVLNRRGKSRCFGFVGYKTFHEASTALKAMNGTLVMSKHISVQFYEPNPLSGKSIFPSTTLEHEPTERDDSEDCEYPEYDWTDYENWDDNILPTESASDLHDGCDGDPIAGQNMDDDAEKQSLQEELALLRNVAFDQDDMICSLSEDLQQKAREIERLKERVEADYKAMQVEIADWKRNFEMADSRRKIVELEIDRLLWNESRKKREEILREEADKARMKAELEESQRKMREFLAEEEEHKRAQKEKREREEAAERLREEEAEQKRLAEKIRKARDEAERKVREEESRKKKETEQAQEQIRMKRWKEATEKEDIRCRQRDSDMRGRVWTKANAFERFRNLLGEFDTAKFSEEKPLSPWIIPWPIMHFPAEIQDVTIDWNHVEVFFAYAKTQLSLKDYNTLVEKAHRIFHPDKWRSRRILDTVMDTEIRSLLEKTGNIASQALTPLWRMSKGYD